jgi:hypothetical protein
MVVNFECKRADLSIWFLSQEKKEKERRGKFEISSALY